MRLNHFTVSLVSCAGMLLAAAPATAGDLWEITSLSMGPDGKPMPYTTSQCLPANAMDPATVLGGMGSCTFDQKSGTASAVTFSMTCKTPGMPAELGSMKVTGDANMSGSSFDMRYVISAGPQATGIGSDFKMNGTAHAQKKGACSPQ